MFSYLPRIPSLHWSSIADSIPPIIFSTTLSFSLLRIVCISALISVFQVFSRRGLYNGEFFTLVIGPIVIIHHFAIALGPRLSIPGILDLIFLFGEIAGLSYSMLPRIVDRWSPQAYVFSVMTSWVLLISLALFAALKVAETVKRKGRNLITEVDITDVSWNNGVTTAVTGTGFYIPGTPSNGNLYGSGGKAKRPNPIYVLTGQAIWKEHFLGETMWIIISRGILSALIVIAIVIYGVFNIVLEPVRETGLIPVKELRSTDIPWDFKTSTTTVWNVVLTRMIIFDDRDDFLASFPDAVSVIPLWDKSRNTTGPPCSYVPEARTLYDGSGTEKMEVITFHCPTRVPIPADAKSDVFPLRYQDSQPDLLIIVNFTMLHIPPDLMMDMPRNSVQVMLSLTNKTDNVVSRTSPTTLFPGLNLIGTANLAIRQQFTLPTLSAFGLFDALETFLISEIVYVVNDPQAQISPLIPRSPGVSTFRIFSQNDFSEWKIIQDYRDKSVLKGFASVGGLWTFLGGVFSVMFGTSIMRILFGIKPISVFGVTHSFQEEKIRQACVNEYPRIVDDMKIALPDRGLLSLISDHIIDLEFLLKDVKPEQNSDPSSNGAEPMDVEDQTTAPRSNPSIPLQNLNESIQLHDLQPSDESDHQRH